MGSSIVKIVDPDYEKNTIVKMQQMTEEYMIEKGVPDDVIEEQSKKMEESLNRPPSKKYLGSFFGNVIFVLIASLIAAAIVKRNPEAFQEAMQDVED
jgi:uncharacterized protein YacL